MSEERRGSPAFYRKLSKIASLHAMKSADYGDSEDPLANVRAGAELLGVPAWQACLVRIADKIQRVKAYINNGRLANEGVQDAIEDLASYSIIMAVLYEETNRCLQPKVINRTAATTTTSQSVAGKCCGVIHVYKGQPSGGRTTETKSSSTEGSPDASG